MEYSQINKSKQVFNGNDLIGKEVNIDYINITEADVTSIIDVMRPI